MKKKGKDKCKVGNHKFEPTIDPRYLKCVKCKEVKKV